MAKHLRTASPFFFFIRVVPAFLIGFLLPACGRRDTVPHARTGDLVPVLNLLTTTREYDPARHQAAYEVAQWWQALGLNTQVTPLPFNELTEALRDRSPDEKDWHAFMYGWSGRVERGDPDMFIHAINHSSQAGGAGYNYSEYSNPEFDALAEAQRRIADPELRRTVVHAAQEILAEDVPFIALYYRHVLHAYRRDRWDNMTAMAGEGLYHEWLPFHAVPLQKTARRLVVAGVQEPHTLNPLAAATVWEWNLLRLLYDKLARVNPFFRAEPWAAEEIRQMDDTLFEVTLRPDMRFHDGKPVRPEDVLFSFNFMITRDTAYFRPFLEPIESVVLMESGAVRFRLRRPYAPFVASTLAQIPILPEHLWRDWNSNQSDVPLVGSGPLIFDEWIPGRHIRLAAWPDYFASAEIHMTGLEYRMYPDPVSVLEALLKGEADMSGSLLDPKSIPVIESVPELAAALTPDIGFHFMGFNCHSPPFNCRVMREAASRAIDLEALVERLLDGHGDPGGPGQSISTGNPFWKNQAVPFHPFDPQRARQTLAEAGYTWDETGRLRYP